MKKTLKSFLINLLIYTLIVGAITSVSIATTINVPDHYRYSDDDWNSFNYSPEFNQSEFNIVLDAHSHSRYSYGELTPRQNILWHISMGYNALILTDHNNFEGCEEIRDIARQDFNDSIKVFMGVEWTTDRGHFNLVFPATVSSSEVENLIPSKSYVYKPTNIEIQQIFNQTHQLGGVVIVNHIQWSREFCKGFPNLPDFLLWQIDYIEIVNENIFDHDSFDFCMKYNLGIITGTDMHIPGKVYGWTLMDAQEFSEDAIFNELITRNTSVLYNQSGSTYDVSHKLNLGYDFMVLFTGIGNMLKKIYEHPHYILQYVIFFSLIYGFYFFIEFTKHILKKQKIMKDR